MCSCGHEHVEGIRASMAPSAPLLPRPAIAVTSLLILRSAKILYDSCSETDITDLMMIWNDTCFLFNVEPRHVLCSKQKQLTFIATVLYDKPSCTVVSKANLVKIKQLKLVSPLFYWPHTPEASCIVCSNDTHASVLLSVCVSAVCKH